MRDVQRRGGHAVRGGNVHLLEAERSSSRTLLTWFAAALLVGGAAGVASVVLAGRGGTAIAARQLVLSGPAPQQEYAGTQGLRELAPVTAATAAEVPLADGSASTVVVSAPVTSVYWDNCAHARSAGAAPIHVGEPGYRASLDGDGDGIACEPYRRR